MSNEKKPVVVDEGALRIAAKLYERLDRDTQRKGNAGALEDARLALLNEVATVAKTCGKPHEIIRTVAGTPLGVTLFSKQGFVHLLVEEAGKVTAKAGADAYTNADTKALGEATLQLRWDIYRREWASDMRDDWDRRLPRPRVPDHAPAQGGVVDHRRGCAQRRVVRTSASRDRPGRSTGASEGP